MNLWILLVMIGVVAFLVFGKNPVREFQNQQREIMKKYGDDEITIRTNMYIEQKKNEQSGESMFGSAYGGAANNAKKSGDQNISDMKEAMKSSATAPESDLKPFKGVPVAPSSDYSESDILKNLTTEQNPKNDVNTVISNVQATTPNYYPPIVKPSVPDVKISDKIVKLTGNEPKLRSGQPIIYDGIYVYTVDNKGEKVALPDGDYTFQDGRKMTVSGGQKIVKY